MCSGRVEGGGAREVPLAILLRRIQRSVVELAALEEQSRRRLRERRVQFSALQETMRRQVQENDALQADISASQLRMASLQAEANRIRAETARTRRRAKFHFFLFLFLLCCILTRFL